MVIWVLQRQGKQGVRMSTVDVNLGFRSGLDAFVAYEK